MSIRKVFMINPVPQLWIFYVIGLGDRVVTNRSKNVSSKLTYIIL